MVWLVKMSKEFRFSNSDWTGLWPVHAACEEQVEEVG